MFFSERIGVSLVSVLPLPVAAADTATAVEGGSNVTIDVVANDTHSGTKAALTVTLDDTLTAGSVAVDGSNDVTYTPPGTAQTDTFAYTITDSAGESNSATVTVTVQAAPGDPYGALVQASGTLIAWYRFKETGGATLVDTSGNGRDGTYRGSPAFGAPPLVTMASDGRATNFGGIADAIVAHHASLKRQTMSVTVIFRMTAGAISGGRRIMQSNTSGLNAGNWGLRAGSGGAGTCTLFFQDSSTRSISSAEGALQADTKHAATVVFEATGVKLYLDGVLIGTDSSHTIGTVGNTAPLEFAVDEAGVRCDVRIDEAFLHEEALTAEQVLALHESETGGGGGGGDEGEGSAWNPVAGINILGLTPSTTHNVSTEGQLATAISALAPGHHIVLANGTYGSNRTINASGTQANPIVIRASTLLGATLTGTLTINGSWVIVHGLNTRAINIEGAPNARVSRCKVTVGTITVPSGSPDYSIDYCEIGPNTSRAIWVRPQVGASSNGGGAIWRNYIHDIDSASNVALLIGNGNYQAFSSDYQTFIGHNLIVNCSYAKSIEFKTGGVRCFGNTLINSGSIQSRNGRESYIGANWQEGSGSVLVHGDDHVIVGNYSNNTGTGSSAFSAQTGNTDADSEVSVQGGGTTAHSIARRCLFSGNTGGLRIGYSSAQPRQPANNTIENHTGAISIFSGATGTVDNRGSASTIPVPTAVKLTTSDVGPNAT